MVHPFRLPPINPMVHVSCLRNRPGQFHLRLPSPRQSCVLVLQRPTRTTPDRLRGSGIQFLGTILHGQREDGTDVHGRVVGSADLEGKTDLYIAALCGFAWELHGVRGLPGDDGEFFDGGKIPVGDVGAG